MSDWTMGAYADQERYGPDFDARLRGRDPRVAPTARERSLDYLNSPVGAMQGIYKKAPDDVWRQTDLDALQQDIVPDVGMNLFAASPQQAPAVARAQAEGARDVASMVVPQSPTDAAFMFALGPVGGKLARTGVGAAGLMGELVDPAEAGVGSRIRAGVGSMGRILAAPEEINRAAAASAKGITQPQLRKLYGELGLTGSAPSELLGPSLAAAHDAGAIQAAIDLKMADRAVLDTMTPKQRKGFTLGGKVPEGFTLPSREAGAAEREAFKPVKKEITKAEAEFDANVARGNRPTIFDLSPQTLNRTPDVPQFNLPRVAPEQTERLASVSRGGLQRIERAAAAAPEENWGWYNLMEARDRFRDYHGAARGDQAFNAWLDSVAGTSMVNPIDNNLRSSTWYLQQILQGKPLPETMQIKDPAGKSVKLMVGGPPAGYGAKSQIQHADRVREYLTNSYDPVTNPKPISYRMNLGGNWMPRTVDTHDIRNLVGMPAAKEIFKEDAALLPKEYAYLEKIGQRAADRAGAPQAGQQAATWVGGGEYTGLKSYPAPLMEALNRRAHVTGAVRDISPEQALKDAFTGKMPLLSVGGASVLAPGVMSGIAAQDEYQ